MVVPMLNVMECGVCSFVFFSETEVLRGDGGVFLRFTLPSPHIASVPENKVTSY